VLCWGASTEILVSYSSAPSSDSVRGGVAQLPETWKRLSNRTHCLFGRPGLVGELVAQGRKHGLTSPSVGWRWRWRRLRFAHDNRPRDPCLWVMAVGDGGGESVKSTELLPCALTGRACTEEMAQESSCFCQRAGGLVE